MPKKASSARSSKKKAARSIKTKAHTIHIDSVRLVHLQSHVEPDAVLFEEKPLELRLRMDVAHCSRRDGWTSFFFEAEAELPAQNQKKKRKKPIWELEARFFVTIDHDKNLTSAAIKEFITASAIPVLGTKFMGVVETTATLGGIPFFPSAVVGIEFGKVEFSIVNELDAEK